MQLGKSLLGAIIGAAIGIVILLVVYRLFEIDGFWLAIPFAIITGLGVRMLVKLVTSPDPAGPGTCVTIAYSSPLSDAFCNCSG